MIDFNGSQFESPIAMIWSGALVLDFIGHRTHMTQSSAYSSKNLARGDLGGKASTTHVGAFLASLIELRRDSHWRRNTARLETKSRYSDGNFAVKSPGLTKAHWVAGGG